MAFTPKGWINFPNKTTPLNATALKALEQRLASYSAAEAVSPGAGDYEAFRVKQRGAGANMTVDVGLAATLQQAWVRDAASGVYRYEYNGAQMNVAISVADGTNPRIDRVVATAPTSIDSIVPQVIVLAGTPTAGATTANLSGAQAIPAGYTLLADIVVGAAVGSITNANIVDRRSVGGGLGFSGVMPYGQTTVGTGRDEVLIQPSEDLPLGPQTLTPTTHDNFQGAYTGYLSRRIVGATRMRIRYAQGATPATTQYIVAILDASGRLLALSGATAFAGAASSMSEISLAIATTTFEAGPVMVFFGVAALTAASAVSFHGVQGNGTVTAPGPAHRNQRFSLGSGGVVFPATNRIDAFTDVVSLAAAYTALPMPLVSLSVG